MRFLAIITGAAMIAAATHAAIIASGGYVGAHWVLPFAIAAGLVVGSVCVGRAWRSNRRALAVVIGFSVIAGELFALINTGERIIAQRESAKQPYQTALTAHHKATAALRDARAAVPTTTPRLETATAALERIQKSAASTAAEKHCAANCRAVLEQQAVAAQNEVEAARRELEERQRAAGAAIKSAETALAAAPMPATAAGLADRLGIDGWSLDLISAALGSIAVNGLGAALIAFGAHGHVRSTPQHEENAAQPPAPSATHKLSAPPAALPAPSREEPEPAFLTLPDLRQHAARFALETLCPAPDRKLTAAEVFSAYKHWSELNGTSPAPEREIGAALATLFRERGYKFKGGALLGVQVRERSDESAAA